MKKQLQKKLSAFIMLMMFSLFAADAQIVYTDINPDDTKTCSYSGGNGGCGSMDSVDINNDGVYDLKLWLIVDRHHISFALYQSAIVRAYPLNGSAIRTNSSGDPLYLNLNDVIKSSGTWTTTAGQILISRSSSPGQSNTTGNWITVTDGFLGLKIISGSQMNYCWVRLNVSAVLGNPTSASFTLKNFSYNSIPDQAILAGETSCATPTVNLTQSGSLSFCAGDSVTFTANGTGYQYQWKKNNVNIAGATAKKYSAKTGGDYKCKVTNSCGSKTSGIKTVTVNCRESNENVLETLKNSAGNSSLTTPNCLCSVQGYGCGALNPGCVIYCHSYCTICTVPLSLSASGSLSFCSGDSVVLTVNRAGTYQWKKNGVNISGATLQSYTAKTSGTYKCKVTNTYCGAELSPGKKVKVTCRNSNENFVDALEQLSVYPNPATNSVTVNFPSDEPGEIQIVNLFGQIIFSEKINQEQTQIDVSKFSEGMYIVRWSSGENFETKTFSIIK